MSIINYDSPTTPRAQIKDSRDENYDSPSSFEECKTPSSATRINTMSSRRLFEPDNSQTPPKGNFANISPIAKEKSVDITFSQIGTTPIIKLTPTKRERSKSNTDSLETSPVKKQHVEKKLICPEAPQKVIDDKRVSEKNKIFRKVNVHTLKQQGIKLNFLDSGRYKNTYVNTPDAMGTRYVYKFYKQDMLDYKINKLNNMTEYSKKQCDKAIEAGLNCARILNDPSIEGFFKQEFIAYSLNKKYPFLQNDLFTEAQQVEVNKLIDQLVHFYEVAQKENLDLDLRLDNFRIKENDVNNTIYLVDFREEQESDNDDKESFGMDGGTKCVFTSILNETQNHYTLFGSQLRKAIEEKIPALKKDIKDII
jgi:hypothetical protein